MTAVLTIMTYFNQELLSFVLTNSARAFAGAVVLLTFSFYFISYAEAETSLLQRLSPRTTVSRIVGLSR